MPSQHHHPPNTQRFQLAFGVSFWNINGQAEKTRHVKGKSNTNDREANLLNREKEHRRNRKVMGRRKL